MNLLDYLPEVSTELLTNPRDMILYGYPKCGKTTAIAEVFPKNRTLFLDFEKGTDYVGVKKLIIIGINPTPKTVKMEKDNPEVQTTRYKSGNFYLSEVVEMINQYREKNNGESPYDYVIVDTLTAMYEYVVPEATRFYMRLPVGKKFNRGDDGKALPTNEWESVEILPNGAGYNFIRDEFARTITMIKTLADHRIYIGHIRDKIVDKSGKQVAVEELDLTGKLRNIFMGQVDAIGYIYKEKNKVSVSFKNDGIVYASTRIPRLDGNNFLLTEYDSKTQTFIKKENPFFDNITI